MQNKILKAQFDKIAALDIGSAQKATLMLVLGGEKPAMYLNVYSHNKTTPTQIKHILAYMKLDFVDRNVFDNPRHIGALTVARTNQQARELHRATDIEQDHAKVGRLLGYPESAIKAFVSRWGLLIGIMYPPDMRTNPLGFKLSYKGKTMESILIRRWMKYVHDNSPEVYFELYEHLILKS